MRWKPGSRHSPVSPESVASIAGGPSTVSTAPQRRGSRRCGPIHDRERFRPNLTAIHKSRTEPSRSRRDRLDGQASHAPIGAQGERYKKLASIGAHRVHHFLCAGAALALQRPTQPPTGRYGRAIRLMS